MVVAGQSFNNSANDGHKVGWWGDSIVHQYEISRQSLHLPEHWKTLAYTHFMQDHAGRGIVKVISGKVSQVSTVSKDKPQVRMTLVLSAAIRIRPHPARDLYSHQFRTTVS